MVALLDEPLLRVDEDGEVREFRDPEAMSASDSYVSSFPPLFVLPGRVMSAITFVCTVGVVLACTVFKEHLQAHGVSTNLLLKYVSIPVVSTLFTYFHIWAALYMTFYPLQYRGCLQIPDTNVGCGWQGIVPNRAEKMARISVKLMTEKLITVQDMFGRIDPLLVAEELDPVLHTTLGHIIDETAIQMAPDIWRILPHHVKDELISKAREDAPPAINALMQEVKENIDSMFDLTEMVVNALVRDPGLLNHMFITCGYKELCFIRDCGAYMGAIFGVVQVILWIFYTAGWMLPTFGLVVGIFSNWIALKMIFEPVEPVRLFGGRMVLQGLFLKRQREVSAEYGKIVADNVLSSRNLIPAIIQGRFSDELFECIRRHVRVACDKFLGLSKPVLRVVHGKEQLNLIKHHIGEGVLRSLPETMRHAEKYFDEAMDLENFLREKMSEMPPSEFEMLLHPVFQEDEWKLILMGGVLGVVVGLLQWYFLGDT
eukprot:TRINITY_DN51161_c0_g1_i1.p1 TRINITY_DN51161_c0_g1~~TRINITY_DN51161_c0_g1_i1.p1  ORF type:complete len:485 (-),score=89.48 TRINITY_DN51161_c0_g1_i1:100-1554(-)